MTRAGSITVVNNAVWIQANDVAITGTINSGTMPIHFIGCSGVSIDVGGPGSTTTGQMRVDRSELSKLTSTNLTFNAESASIHVYETQSQDTTGVTDRVTFNAAKNLVFADSNVWKSMRGVAPKLNISADIKTWEDHMVFESTEYYVDSGVWVQSEIGNIYVEPTSGGSGSMRSETPVTWRSANDVTFEVPMTVFGSGSIMYQADSDEDGAGTVSFSSVASVTVSDSAVQQIVVTAADVILEANMRAMQANVTVQVSNHSGSTLSVGANHGGLHLSDAELDRITTATTLTLGSPQTDDVLVEGVSLTDTSTDFFTLFL